MMPFMDTEDPIEWELSFQVEHRTYITDRSILIDQRYVFLDPLPPDGAAKTSSEARDTMLQKVNELLSLPVQERFSYRELARNASGHYCFLGQVHLNPKYIRFLLQRVPEGRLFFATTGESSTPLHLYSTSEHIGLLMPVRMPPGETDEELELLAQAGDAMAQYRIAQAAFIKAHQSPKHVPAALKWYAAAAAQGHAKAVLALGGIYCRGKFVERDFVKGLALLDHAIELGCREAVRMRALVIKSMSPGQFRNVSSQLAAVQMRNS